MPGILGGPYHHRRFKRRGHRLYPKTSGQGRQGRKTRKRYGSNGGFTHRRQTVARPERRNQTDFPDNGHRALYVHRKQRQPLLRRRVRQYLSLHSVFDDAGRPETYPRHQRTRQHRRNGKGNAVLRAMPGNNEQITKFIKTTKRRNRGVFSWFKTNVLYFNKVTLPGDCHVATLLAMT